MRPQTHKKPYISVAHAHIRQTNYLINFASSCVYVRKRYPITCLDRLLGLQEFEAPRISRQSAHEGDKVVSLTHRSPLPPQEDIPGTHFC